MGYEDLIKTIPQNEIETIKMNDGSLIQCKKVPLATIDSMDNFLVGIKDGLNITNGALNFVATCGKNKLFSAVADPSTYMRNKNGDYLSALLDNKKKIVSQPGFKEVELAEQGVKTATTIAKVIPWIALAVTVIEVGTKIVINQEHIRAEQIDRYKNLREISEDNIYNLWQAMNDYTTYKGDEAFRSANVKVITDSLNSSRNILDRLSKEAQKCEKINEHLVFAMKAALDVFSFSELLKIMYTSIDGVAEIIKESLNEIEKRTHAFNTILDKCYSQQMENREKVNRRLERTQFNNASKSKKHIATRVALDLASGGLTELGSLASKGIGKYIKPKNDRIIESLEEYKKANNPFAECIKNADDVLMLKKLVMRDDKYLYYQI